MFLTRLLTACGVAAALTLAPASAFAAKKAQTLRGTVTDVSKKDDGTGTVTAKVLIGKKKAGAPEVAEKKFTITKDTKFETMSGKKADAEIKPATFADLAKDAVVAVTVGAGEAADKITIVKGKKKNK